MFTGIIEGLGEVVAIKKEGENVHFSVQCDFTNEMKIDQSLAHNGVCLTIVEVENDAYTVTAIKETLDKSSLGGLVVGSKVNLERAMEANGRFDGHVVQGHVDQTAICTKFRARTYLSDPRYYFFELSAGDCAEYWGWI